MKKCKICGKEFNKGIGECCSIECSIKDKRLKEMFEYINGDNKK